MGTYAFGGGEITLRCSDVYESRELERALKNEKEKPSDSFDGSAMKLVTATDIASAIGYIFPSGFSIKRNEINQSILVEGSQEGSWSYDGYESALDSLAEHCIKGLIELKGGYEDTTWRHVFAYGKWYMEEGELYFPSDFVLRAEPLIDRINELLKAAPHMDRMDALLGADPGSDRILIRTLKNLRKYIAVQSGMEAAYTKNRR